MGPPPPLPNLDACPCLQRPDEHCLVVAARREHLAVGRPSHAVDTAVVARQGGQQAGRALTLLLVLVLELLQCPHPHHRIYARRLAQTEWVRFGPCAHHCPPWQHASRPGARGPTRPLRPCGSAIQPCTDACCGGRVSTKKVGRPDARQRWLVATRPRNRREDKGGWGAGARVHDMRRAGAKQGAGRGNDSPRKPALRGSSAALEQTTKGGSTSTVMMSSNMES